MTKIKTSELTGAALDWAVAKCEGKQYIGKGQLNDFRHSRLQDKNTFSISWSQGGPIIEREGITTRRFSILEDAIKWGAYEMPSIRKPKPNCVYGPTPLIAAMRCFVASKLGEDVSIPEELIK